MPQAEAQRHPCDGGASGTAVAGLAATPTHSNYLHIHIYRQFRKSAPGEQLNALRLRMCGGLRGVAAESETDARSRSIASRARLNVAKK